jgi:hypothetical protein
MRMSYDLAVFYISVNLIKKRVCWIIIKPRPFGCFRDQGSIEIVIGDHGFLEVVFIPLPLFFYYLIAFNGIRARVPVFLITTLRPGFPQKKLEKNIYIRRSSLFTIGCSRNKSRAYQYFSVEARPVTRSFTWQNQQQAMEGRWGS